MTLSTSRNLTVLGILTILGALATAGVVLFDGDPATNPSWEALFVAVSAGIGMLMGKGAASTGGTVDAKGTPVVDPSPPTPAP